MQNDFTTAAARLCGLAALCLGWLPHEFWASTPAELGCIMAALNGQDASAAPPTSAEIATLLEMHPDARRPQPSSSPT